MMSRKAIGPLGLATFTLTFGLLAEAYKAPSVPEVCESMIPTYLKGVAPQTSEPPFQLTVSHTHIKSGAHVDITLTRSSKTSKEKFQGFMVQVRLENSTKPFGVFVQTHEAKYLYCLPGKKNVLVNNNERDRKILKTTWACPPRFKGVVSALATIYRNRTEYWVGLKSNTIKIGQHHGVRIKGYDISDDSFEDHYAGGVLRKLYYN